MSLLINCQSVCKAYGSQELFHDLSFSVFSNDRIALIGPNGVGKSTLLKILVALEESDRGTISLKKGLKIGYVPQISEFPAKTPLAILLEEQQEQYIAEMWLTKLGFNLQEKSAATLSGGWQRRLAIAKAMIHTPDLLLLDEPTNHLDLEGVLWLEKFLKEEVPTFIVVSHDRCFLQNMTNRTMEMSPLYPEGLFAIKGSFTEFSEKKELFIAGQLQQEQSIASKARRESEWLRLNPQARSTKSRSRIERAGEILAEHAMIKKRNVQKSAGISFQASGRETRKLLVAKNLTFNYAEKTLFEHLDVLLTPGTRLGLMGPNGSGKSTLLKLLAAELLPTQGTIKRAENLKVVYFDQHRSKLAPNLTLHEALAPNGEYVYFQERPIHINSWCQRFLFPQSYLSMPIGKLSGGERARISIAKLMVEPADILLLDEPTNDLDIPTLEVLEENLIEFEGAIVLITHDRFLLQKSCNLFLALTPHQPPHIYKQYSEWEASCTTEKPSKEKKVREPQKNEKRAIQQVERAIADHEGKLHELTQKFNKPEIMADPEQLQKICKQISLTEREIESLYKKLELLD